MSRLAINHPIATLMFVCALVFFGILALLKITVALFPNVDAPVVTITTIYPGANAESVESKVTDKIEEAISGISNLKKITSTSADSVSIVVAEFELEKPIEEATNDIRDKVSTVSFTSDVHSPIIEKFDVGGAPVISLFMSLPEDKAQSDKALLEMNIHANLVLKPILQKIKGVGRVNLVGYLERKIFILPDPTLLNKYGLSYTDIARSVQAQNVEVDGGRIIAKTKEFNLLTDASAQNLQDLGDILVGNGVRLSDIAKITDGLEEPRTFSSIGIGEKFEQIEGKGSKGILFEIQKISGANEIEIANAVKNSFTELKNLSPNYQLKLVRDGSAYIQDSINAVKFDLILGAVLAVLIVFFFLRSGVITIIAAFSIPVSILGTFAGMQWLGQSMNLATMIAVTLSIGIIIDDAIVVVENIYRKIENSSTIEAKEAAYLGVREIGFAIIAISAMLLAVFIPIASMQGIVGRFFTSFGLSVVMAICISYVVVTTFMPMLASRLLARVHGHSAFYIKTQKFFESVDNAYCRLLEWVLEHKLIVIVLIVGIFTSALFIASKLGIEFLPSEDKSEFTVKITAKPGISIQEMQRQTLAIQDVVDKQEGVSYSLLNIGFTSEKKVYDSQIYVGLVDREERKATQNQIMEQLRGKLEQFSKEFGLEISLIEIPVISLGEDDSPLQVSIFAYNQKDLQESANALLETLKKHPQITDVHTNLQPQKPQIRLHIKRAEANHLGITALDIAMALNYAFSGEQQVSIYKENGKEYDILLRTLDSKRASVEDLRYLQVRNAKNEPVFLEGVVTFEEVGATTSIKRHNRQRSIDVLANLQEGFTLGDAVSVVENSATGENGWLKGGANYSIEGYSKFLKETVSAFIIAMLTAFILIYFILASLYESLLQPLIIMVTLPLSFTGAFLALYLSGSSLSMFSFMGLMLLMGLVGKNATLIIDVANARIREGMQHKEAIIEAGKERLRPILMTTIAMVFGMIPLAFTSGAGSTFKSPMGISVIGGLLFAMILSLLIVPVLYKIIDPIDSKLRNLYK